MAAPSAGKPEQSAQSDSQKLDQIAAYVREQKKADQSFTSMFGKLTVYLALAAFFFGVGTFSDLLHRLSPSYPDPLPSQQRAAKDAFVKSLDNACPSLITTPQTYTGNGYPTVAANDLAVLNARLKLNQVWAMPVPNTLATQDFDAFAAIRSDYYAANALLQAAVARAWAGDGTGYAEDIGQYRAINAAFLRAAAAYGFTTCDWYWGVADPLPLTG